MRDDRRVPRRRLCCSALALTVVGPAAVTAETSDASPNAVLGALLDATALRRGYVAATPAEAARSEELFLRLLRGERGEDLAAGLRALGFALEVLRLGDEALAVVREAPGAATGKGLYVVRRPANGIAPVALQAPHRFFDEDTGTIAARLLAEELRFAAAAWNTVPRHYDDAATGRRVDSDLAHAPVSHLNAFTRAFARAHPGGLVAQLHGFDQGRRRSASGAEADMIASGGTDTPGRQVRARVACLRMATPWKVLLFPEDVRELGGTTNTNAAALRTLGGQAEFLHLEMARDLRRDLVRQPALRARLAECLAGGRQ